LATDVKGDSFKRQIYYRMGRSATDKQFSIVRTDIELHLQICNILQPIRFYGPY
jgi:hypothetical protein